jgi:hypothetical protein
MLIGAVLGGVVGKYFGLTAPFWLGLVGVGLVAGCMWRVLNNRDIEASRSAARSAVGVGDGPADHQPHD